MPISRPSGVTKVLLSLSVDPEDVGRVIGRRGATAQSLRTLLRALGTKNEARYNLKIVNTDAPESDRKDGEASADENPDASREATSVDETDRNLADKTRAEMADLDDLDI